MSGRFLLDTNIAIAIFAAEPAVLQRLATVDEVFVPAIALGELYYGARKSARAEANINRIDEFAAAVAILGCDGATARHYGRIKDDLKAKGRPIPENDIWIAAVAAQHGLIVVSRDDHFANVAGLLVEVW
ncbi:MAG: type II toxin-antitoxin system VapC family toxin [Pseudomonadota bacterium]|nr:type II toxin-antitoxin system VapC family toxin [Gammaproteobacteria bacterium]MDQ3581365.1 type II toxin-antitoxin system VapC family toxin [Pseudomonadota bacterium]